jgi:uncharacterized repeat protein (TIGR02543 family)
MTPRISSVLFVLLLGIGLVPVTGGTAEAVVGTAAQVTAGVTGYGAVFTNGGPTCASLPSNPQSNEHDCTPSAPDAYDSCTTDSTGLTTCSVLLSEAVSDPAGWHFTGWSGDCTGTTPTCRVTTSERECELIGGKPHCLDTFYDVKAVAHFADDRAPTVSLTAAPAADAVVYNDSRSQQLGFTSNENAEGVTYVCSRDSAGYAACGTPFTWSSIADGVHSFCVRGTDASGLMGGAACRSWEQETNPTVTIVNHPAAYTPVAGPVSFTYTSNKDDHPADGSTLTYQCRLDSAGYAPCSTGGKSYPWLPNGTHTFSVEAVFHGVDDAPGTGRTALATYTWTQSDNVGPALTWSTPDGLTTTAPGQVAWTSDGDGDTFRCGLDQPTDGNPVTLTSCSSPYDLPDLADGVHTLTVEARDHIGNTVTAYWSVDVEHRPAAVITSGPAPAATVGGSAVTFGLDSDRPHVQFLCALDGGTLQPCTDPTGAEHLPGLAAGPHTLTVLPRYQSPLGGSLDGDAVVRTWTTVLPPSCSIRMASSRVRHHRAAAVVVCSTASTGAVTGFLTVRVPHHRARAVQTRVSYLHLDAGRPVTVGVRLTAFELRALRHHWRVRGVFRVVASNLGGSGTAVTPRLRLR